MFNTRTFRVSVLSAFFAILGSSGWLFAQQGLSGAISGALSSGQAAQILGQLQGSGIGGISLPSLSTGSTPQIANQSALPPLPTNSSQNAQNPNQPTQPAVTAPPSSIEQMFSSRLPPGSSPLVQFGYDFFQRQQTTTLVPTGDDYVVGPGDVLIVYLWGDSVDLSTLSNRYQLNVDRNGFVFFPPVGNVATIGLTLSALRNYLKATMLKQYNKFDLAVALQTMRQFPVYVTGFVNSPGPVPVSTVNSVFDAISAADGIMKTGSLRNIQLTHAGNSRSETIDIYDSIISGKSSSILLRDGDSIFVPGIGPIAAVAGAVKRPAIYELKDQGDVSQVIALAGGFLPSANRDSVSIVRFKGNARQLVDSTATGASLQSMRVDDGDLVSIDSIRDYVFNDVEVEGEAMDPGSFSVERAPTLRDVLNQAGLLPDTDLFYGRIYRMDQGGASQNFTFSPKDVLSGNANLKLQGRDRVVLYPFGTNLGFVDFDDFPNTVTLEGDVRYPGMYAWKEGLKLSEIFGSGNFLVDTNAQYAIILRQKLGLNEQSIVTFTPSEIGNSANDVTLQPLDRVQFFPKTNFAPIQVSGSVKQSKMVQYYGGIDLIDVLRIVSLNDDPSHMKASIYRQSAYVTPQPPTTPVQVPTPTGSLLANALTSAASTPSATVSASAAPTTTALSTIPSASSSISQAAAAAGATGALPVYPATMSPTAATLPTTTPPTTQSGTIDVSGETTGGPYGETVAVTGPGVAPPTGAAPMQQPATAQPATAPQTPSGAGAKANGASAAPGAPTAGLSAPANQPQNATASGTSGTMNGTTGTANGSTATVSQTVQQSSGAVASTPPTSFVVYLDDFLRDEATTQFPLYPGDQIVFSPNDTNDKNPQVTVRGQVARPGAFALGSGTHLSDVIREAGDFTPDAYPQGLVLLRQSTADFQSQQLTRATQTLQFVLQQNIAQSAAGLPTSSADAAAALQIQIQAQQAEISALRTQISGVLGRVSIAMPKTLKELAGSPADILLEKNDAIFIPKTPNFVQIIGSVYNPVVVTYRPGLTVKDYLALAGGPTTSASTGDSYVILADGTIESARQRPWKLIGGRSLDNDAVGPGETIVVSPQPISAIQILPIVSQVTQTVGSIASTALSVLAILKL